MDIIQLKQILETLNSVGINEMILEPSEKDGVKNTLIRGSNRDRTVVLYHEIPDLNLTDTIIGVQSVNGLLSRINLFDEAKASIELDVAGGMVGTVRVKQGRRKATYRCADPSSLKAPTHVPGGLTVTADNAIMLSKDSVDFLGQAISSMSLTGNKEERNIAMKVEGGNLTVKIVDGEDDSFTEVMEGVGGADTGRGMWDVGSFLRVMKKSAETSDIAFRRIIGSDAEVEVGGVLFSVSEFRVAIFAVADLDILVIPVA